MINTMINIILFAAAVVISFLMTPFVLLRLIILIIKDAQLILIRNMT